MKYNGGDKLSSEALANYSVLSGVKFSCHLIYSFDFSTTKTKLQKFEIIPCCYNFANLNHPILNKTIRSQASYF